MNREFGRGICTFEIGCAENGFVFGEYDVNTDAYKVVIASSPSQLSDIIRKWTERKILTIEEWATRTHNSL
jgi:hypothetical protein